MIIERLGKYHRTLYSGINIIPLVDEPRKLKWRYVVERTWAPTEGHGVATQPRGM